MVSATLYKIEKCDDREAAAKNSGKLLMLLHSSLVILPGLVTKVPCSFVVRVGFGVGYKILEIIRRAAKLLGPFCVRNYSEVKLVLLHDAMSLKRLGS